MKVTFDKSFLKSIDRLSNDTIKNKIVAIILEIDAANSIIDIKNIKKMTGYKYYYRIRIGDYRLGLEE